MTWNGTPGTSEAVRVWKGAAAMGEAADQAFEELRGLRRNATEEQSQGMDMLTQWLARWFGKAGYKRLCRPLVASKRGEV